ncbi:hypothetical protein AALO_G00249230 [Alosa alosa]|uniref:UDP-glucose 4-epimerase n=2 Tax=Alosa alosa TaxID=278164 RepID=A0AAV6FTL0_9TELE|nr:hypothetical protein AALO_G00249230 [Alosa alosa]
MQSEVTATVYVTLSRSTLVLLCSLPFRFFDRTVARRVTGSTRGMAQKVLVTGGGGYIGSHCVVELIEAGFLPVVIDNFSNAVRGEGDVPESLRRIEAFLDTTIEFHELDLLDKPGLERIFKKHKFHAVMHFAGLKAVGESVEQPLRYYRVNLTGSINLLEVMQAHGVHNVVFSSSATVYGDPQKLPIDESHPAGACTNPYGQTKYFIEEMIKDHCKAEKDWNAVLLRYFNPIGAHISGQIGEDPQGIPNNLLPYVAQVAIGRRKQLNVFGNDYNTIDGTGVRDYIHVVDLAKGHIAALRKLEESCGCKVYNLGTGTGYSVLQMVKAMEKVSGRKIAYQIAPRRSGDIASCYADPQLAEKELGWKAQFDLERMCEDLWRWQSKNPTGFCNGTAE